jgi:DNA-binding MarR family transcriptional regulator
MNSRRSRSKDSQAAIARLEAQIERDLAGIRRAMRQELEAEYAKGNVTLPQKAVMQIVVQTPGITLKDLSHAVSLAHSTVSGIVDRLESRGLIERRPDPADRRLSRLYPSSAVTRFVRERIPALRSGPLHAALARASAADRSRIASALQRLRQLLESN